MVNYHDREWGVPIHDDQRLFELLTLEGAQAGLSWATVLRRREAYRDVFAGFNIERVAAFTDEECAAVLSNAGIIRNRLKVRSTVENARIILLIQERYGTFSAFLWHFVDHRPVQNGWQTQQDVPARTEASDALSKALKELGFRFVGSTICYALMQAVGMVNDHTMDCFRWAEVKRSRQILGQSPSASVPS